MITITHAKIIIAICVVLSVILFIIICIIAHKYYLLMENIRRYEADQAMRYIERSKHSQAKRQLFGIYPKQS